jgi:hypothetical protein
MSTCEALFQILSWIQYHASFSLHSLQDACAWWLVLQSSKEDDDENSIAETQCDDALFIVMKHGEHGPVAIEAGPRRTFWSKDLHGPGVFQRMRVNLPSEQRSICRSGRMSQAYPCQRPRPPSLSSLSVAPTKAPLSPRADRAPLRRRFGSAWAWPDGGTSLAGVKIQEDSMPRRVDAVVSTHSASHTPRTTTLHFLMVRFDDLLPPPSEEMAEDILGVSLHLAALTSELQPGLRARRPPDRHVPLVRPPCAADTSGIFVAQIITYITNDDTESKDPVWVRALVTAVAVMACLLTGTPQRSSLTQGSTSTSCPTTLCTTSGCTLRFSRSPRSERPPDTADSANADRGLPSSTA